jgi:secondary thiamine-phosphate synthase enzyme
LTRFRVPPARVVPDAGCAVRDTLESGQQEITMKQSIRHLSVETTGRGLFEMTSQLQGWVGEQLVQTGMLTVFCQHTSASLLIQENADPSVQRDIGAYFERIAPEDPHRYEHATEGADDMPAHLRAALTEIHLAIPVERGQLALGTWQGVYLFEHRLRPQRRNVVLHLIGE